MGHRGVRIQNPGDAIRPGLTWWGARAESRQLARLLQKQGCWITWVGSLGLHSRAGVDPNRLTIDVAVGEELHRQRCVFRRVT